MYSLYTGAYLLLVVVFKLNKDIPWMSMCKRICLGLIKDKVYF